MIGGGFWQPPGLQESETPELSYLNQISGDIYWCCFGKYFFKIRFFKLKAHLNPLHISFRPLPHWFPFFCSICSLEIQRPVLMLNKNQKEQPWCHLFLYDWTKKITTFSLRKLFWFKIKTVQKVLYMYIFPEKKPSPSSDFLIFSLSDKICTEIS